MNARFVYRVTLETMDYVFYATFQVGRVYRTGPYIGNYALAFAFHRSQYPRRGEPNYEHPPWVRYREELRRWDGQWYIFPARPAEPFRTARQTFNALEESYRLFRVRNSQVPDWGQAETIAPGSRLVTYVVTTDDGWKPGPRLIRLGKWMATCRVDAEPAEPVEPRTLSDVAIEARPRNGGGPRPVYLALEDLRLRPTQVEGALRSRPARIVWGARFAQPLKVLICNFRDETVYLPDLEHLAFAYLADARS